MDTRLPLFVTFLASSFIWADDPPAPLNIARPMHNGELRVWHPRPAPADAQIEAKSVRIVDFGNDYLRGGDGQPRHHFHCHRYTLSRDEETGLWTPGDRPLKTDQGVDIDGDGNSDDVVAYHAFSLTRPFNPVAPWYDTLAGTPRWYGGQAIYQANAVKSGFSEDGVNQDHDGQFAWPRENWAVFHETYERYSPYRVAANWLWLKSDFLNGGDRFRVSFDDASRLALVLKRYFMGVESVRFLVRDGEQCYLSEATLSGTGTHTLCPTETDWAEYDPRAPYDIYFHASQADFKPREFQDVSAVGVYCSKDRLIPAYFGYKWYCLECDATVHRVKRPGEFISMAEVTGDRAVGDFSISTTEVPYELWKNVFRHARSNNFVPPSQGFGFDKDGDMGSMDYPTGPERNLTSHELQEPATDFTLQDAAVWCNALSDLESREPVYYEDAEFTRPLHEAVRSPAFLEVKPTPKLFVKWDADGYRLPTPGEWLRALAEQPLSTETAVVQENSGEQTRPVGSRIPNAFGLYDMLGNVGELIWSFGDCYDPAADPLILVAGGDFLYPSDPTQRSASRFGDRPYYGAYNIGLRIVRREPGGRMPTDGQWPADVPIWKIEKSLVARCPEPPTRKSLSPEMVTVPGWNMEIAQHETTYTLWKQVRDWGSIHGYQTDYDGDMGSMDYWGFDATGQWAEPATKHDPREPVTDVTLFDMAVWCNALSEMTGHRQVYYSDANCLQPYREAVKFRPIQFHFPEDYVDRYGEPKTTNTRPISLGAGASAVPAGAFAEDAARRVLPPLHVDPTADGFRLPFVEEYQQAAMPDGTRYPWGDGPTEVFDYDWTFDSAGGTTHAAGVLKPNALGLFDLVGNVSELSSIDTSNPKRRRTRRLGGSFLDLTLGLARGLRSADAPPETWPYCDTGFRVVRQLPRQPEASPTDKQSAIPLHRRSVEFSVTTKASVFISPDSFDPLVGRVHRGSLYREGVFHATGVPSNPAVKWRRKTEGPVRSSPVVVDGVVYFGSCDGSVYALRAADGDEIWRHDTDGPVTGSAAVVDGVVYVASQDGAAYALEAKTGRRVWRAQCGQTMAGSPAVAYGAVFIGAGNAGGDQQLLMSSGPMLALDAKTGAAIWQSVKGPQGVAAIACDGKRVFGVGADQYGALDMRDGSLLFEVRAGHQTRQFASTAIVGDRLYTPVATRGSVLCMDASGKALWQQSTLASNMDVEVNDGGTPGYEILGDVAVADGLVLTGCNDGKLYAFDAASGRRRWTYSTNGPVQSSPSVADGIVYFGSWDGFLYALDVADGRLCWKLDLGRMPQTAKEQYQLGSHEGGRITSSVWPGDDVLYVGCDDGCLYCIE